VDASPGRPAEVVIVVPEIRDYHAINAEVVRHLDAGRARIRLADARGERLLAAGLNGPWAAVLEVDGHAGPELAAGLDATGLTIVCRGGADDGGASGLRAGRVIVLGEVGVAFGYAQRGGLAVAAGNAEGRAGLGQSGGDLVLLADAGPRAGERQSGGRLYALADRVGPHAGLGRRGGRLIRIARDDRNAADRLELIGTLGPAREWLGPPEGLFSVGPSPAAPGIVG
jgi:methylamine---glutamate N-methyltransferase subunit B